MKSTYLEAGLLSLILSLFASISFSQKVLFIPTINNGTIPEEFDSTTTGPRMNVQVDVNLLKTNQDAIKFFLPNGTANGLVVIANRIKQVPGPDQFAWYGRLEKQPKSFVLFTQVKDVIAGYIRTNDNKLYRINYVGNKVHQVQLIEQRFFRPDRVDLPGHIAPIINEQLKSEIATCCDQAVIDVLVVYTPRAKRAAGGSSGIESQIRQSINLTNTSFNNSNIPVQISLAHSEMVQYTETGSIEDARNALQDSTDNIMDNIHSMRDQYHADIVVLLVANANYSGIGYIMETVDASFESKAFCVVKWDAAALNLSFPHEIGHIMGARHECNADIKLTPYSYSHGYSSNGFRTIMSGNVSATRVEFWSDPYINFGGTSYPTGNMSGDCQAADAESLRKTYITVSRFRCREKCPYSRSFSETTAEPTIEPSVEPTVTPDFKPDTPETTVTPIPPIPEQHSNKWFIIIGAIAVALVVIFWFIWRRRKKEENDRDKL